MGSGANLEAGRRYHVECRVRGSFVTLRVDGVDVAMANLPVSLPQSQVGLWCQEFGIRATRADETYGPGIIIADVVRQIDEARLVIAEISPANPNVYYEVGYAHARGKPAILIADRTIEKLPFDVSPFRTLFYENTIDGKGKVEDGLRKHLKAIVNVGGAAG